MSEAVVVSIILVVPTMLTTIVSMVIKYRQDSKEYRRSNAKLDHITVLTNSNMTAANKEIVELKGRVQELLLAIKQQHGN